jgi:hypothetical protein
MKKTKNNIWARLVIALTIPPKPKSAFIRAITRMIEDKRNIWLSFNFDVVDFYHPHLL